jgi:uncharacterized protein (DUF433 family)
MRHERIVIDAQLMMGKPCIKGTRITVEQILNELSDGASATQVIEAHPHLVIEDVLAAMRYAEDVVHQMWLMTKPVLMGEAHDALSGR